MINDDGKVDITYQTVNGKIRNTTINFCSNFSNYIDDFFYLTESPYTYTINKHKNLGIFSLNKCVYDKKYTEILENFFEEVMDKDITRIAIDIRKNGGGNSSVIQEFLRFININEYKTFGLVSETIKNNQERVKNPYNGKIYVLTSNFTFSSANWFAGVIKYNKIGQVIGDFTGNAPTSFGNTKSIELPNSKLQVLISTRFWLAPNGNNEKSIEPNIYLPVTRTSIIHDIDPAINWLLNQNSRKGI